MSEALTGHAAALRHPALSIATDVTHVLGAGAWIGALFIMVGVGLPALGRMNPADAPRAGSSLTRAYHTAAVDGVILVVLSGVIAAFLRLPAFNALWTTDYGSWLFRKLVFVLIALAFGAYHWRRVVTPEWTDDTRRRFGRSASGRARRRRRDHRAHFTVGLDIAPPMTATPHTEKGVWPITYHDVEAARDRIARYLSPTPFRRYPRLSALRRPRHRLVREARKPPADELVQDSERAVVHDRARRR